MVETKQNNLNKENKMNNKFSLKDVKLEHDEKGGIKVTHMLTGIETRHSSPDGSFTADIFEALKKLEILFNAHYEKENMVEDEPKLTKDEDYLNRRDKIEISAKALEFALKEFTFPLFDDKGNFFYERCDRLERLANRFYNYITKEG